jgi:hypothetical protein
VPPRDGVRLPDVVRCLDGAVAVTNDHPRDLALAGPPELAEAVRCPTDRVADVGRGLRRQQVCCNGKWVPGNRHSSPE